MPVVSVWCARDGCVVEEGLSNVVPSVPVCHESPYCVPGMGVDRVGEQGHVDVVPVG